MRSIPRRWRLNLVLTVSFALPVVAWLNVRSLIGDDWLIPYYLAWLGFLYWAQRKETDYEGVSGYGRMLIIIILACGLLSGLLSKTILKGFVGGRGSVELFPYGLVSGVILLIVMGWLEVSLVRRYFKKLLPLLKLNGNVFSYFSLGFVAALIS